MNKAAKIQLDIKHKSEELQQSIRDLYAWEDEMRDKEKNGTSEPQNLENPPVRSKMKKNKAKNKDVIKIQIEQEPNNNGIKENVKSLANDFKEKGNKCIKLKDYKGAVDCYTAAIELYDKDPIFFCNRSLCYQNLDMHELCISDCNQALKLDSNYVEAYYRRMQAMEAFGDNVGACQDGKKVLILSSDQTLTDQVKKDIERIEKRIKDSEAVAKLRKDKGENKIIREQKNIVLESGPKDKISKMKNEKEGKKEEVELTHQQNDVNIKEIADKLKEQGNKHIGLKEFKQGLDCYTQAITLYDREPIYYSNRGHCHFSLKNYEECINDCNRAIGLDPKFFRPYYRRMQAYEQLQKYEEALLDCVKVLELTNEEKQKIPTQAAMKRIKDKITENKKMSRSNSLIFSDFPQGEAKLITFSNKAPALRSKKPLRRIQIEEVYDPDDKNPPYLADEHIPDSVIDKIFNNNTGENVEEFIAKHEDNNLSNLFPSSTSANLRNMFAPPNKGAIKKGGPCTQKLPPSPSPKSSVENEKTNKEILNAENKRQPSQTPAPKPSEVGVKSPSIPTTMPKSPSEFFLTWETLVLAQKVEYLKRFTECPFEKVIGVNLTDTFLSELLQILDKHCVDAKLPVLHILKGLCKNDEMTILPLMFSADDKMAVKNVVKHLELTEGEGLKNKSDVEFIKKTLLYN